MFLQSLFSRTGSHHIGVAPLNGLSVARAEMQLNLQSALIVLAAHEM